MGPAHFLFRGDHRLLAVDNLAALSLLPTALDLLSPLQAHFVVLLEQSKPLANDLARVVVHSAFDFAVDEFLQLRSQGNVHDSALFWFNLGTSRSETKTMTNAADSIRKGLNEAIRYARGRGPKSTYRLHVPAHVDVKAIRTKLKLTR